MLATSGRQRSQDSATSQTWREGGEGDWDWGVILSRGDQMAVLEGSGKGG